MLSHDFRAKISSIGELVSTSFSHEFRLFFFVFFLLQFNVQMYSYLRLEDTMGY